MSLTPTSEQRRATAPESSIWVAANAGSGKTHVLVERVVRLLLQGAEPASILCITYTKAAAAEMSGRLFKRLGSWAALEDRALELELENLGFAVVERESLDNARRLFTKALETPGGLKIQTIHGFCEKLLHLFPVEAGLAPGFKVMESRESKELRSEAIQKIMSASSGHSDNELGPSLIAIGEATNSDSFVRLIDEFFNSKENYRSLLDLGLNAASFSLVLKNAAELGIGDDLESITSDIISVDREAYLRHASVLSHIRTYKGHDTAAFMAAVAKSKNVVLALKQLFLTAGLDKFRDELMSKGTKKDYPETDAFVNAEMQRLEPLFEKLKRLERIETTTHLFNVAGPIYRQIETQKRLQGRYDFDDLISRCANLLSNSRSAHWVLYKLDSGLKHILVDEAQDTSPAQWQIIEALTDEFYAAEKNPAENPRTLFVVGDRKQSIFSFQGADVTAFNQARFGFSEKIIASGSKFDNVDLTISYRSTKQVLSAVDLVFPPNDPSKLGFAVDEYRERDHTTIRGDEPGIVEIWPLYAELESEEEQPWTAPVDREPAASPRRRLARDIVLKIKSWIDVRYLPSEERNVRPQDILILMQSRGPLFAMIIAELRKAHIPVAGADRLKLLESLAVQDLLALLQWLLLPSDDYALACILKSPLVPSPLNESELFDLAYGRGTESLWDRLNLQANKNAKFLKKLQIKSVQSGPYGLLSQALTAARKSMIGRLGTEAEDATDALLDQAMAYEIEHGPSMTGFLHWITAQETDVKREMEQDSGEVRLMTVHGAKGLEANIVFLADAASIPKSNKNARQILPLTMPDMSIVLPFWRATGKEKSQLQQAIDYQADLRAAQERNRLLYVAMTRACDELYICGTGKNYKPTNGSWYEIIANSLDANGGKRLGADEVYIPKKEESLDQKPDLPDWIFQSAPAEHVSARTHSLTGLLHRYSSKQTTYDVKSAKRGVALHALLQGLASVSPEKRENYVLRKAPTLGLDPQEAILLSASLNQSDMIKFFGPESRSEVELRGYLADGRQVLGRVDRIAVLPDEIYVLDYKSDIHVPPILKPDHVYAQQMALYIQLLELAYPSHKLKAALFWTQNGKLEWLSHELLTQARDQAMAELEPEPS